MSPRGFEETDFGSFGDYLILICSERSRMETIWRQTAVMTGPDTVANGKGEMYNRAGIRRWTYILTI